MSIDCDALNNYLEALNKAFKNMLDAFKKIEKSINNLSSYNNWSGDSREYFFDLTTKLLNDFETVNSKFTNISMYIDSVIDNYRASEQQLAALFGG